MIGLPRALSLSLLLGACAGTGEDSAEAVSSLALSEGARVRYTLSVDWEGTRLDEGARVIQTDQGYQLALSAARISTVGVQLAPCEPEDRAARALDHITTADSSALSLSLVEDLLEAATVDAGVGTTSGQDYCAVHWLAGASEGPSMEGQSVRLEGWLQAPDQDTPRPLAGEIWLAAGGLPGLPAAEAAPEALAEDGEALDAEVEIRRFPARALDGEALDGLSDAEIAYAFLAGLGSGAEARVWR